MRTAQNMKGKMKSLISPLEDVQQPKPKPSPIREKIEMIDFIKKLFLN